MHIAFIHPHKAFLPELNAYRDHFEQKGWKTSVWRPGIKSLPADVSVEWRIMGSQLSRIPGERLLIHEYASPSLPPFYRAKDLAKSVLSVTPDLRIFQSEFVRNCFHFRKSAPFLYRDMGVPDNWLEQSPAGPGSFSMKYDFIYVGSIKAHRNISPLLRKFTRELNDRTLLIVSRDYKDLQKEYRAFPNILFTGPLPQSEVRELILQSAFAINYFPVFAPFNGLTSTKFLEYVSCGRPVISTDYKWIRHFQEQYGGHYFFLQNNLENFTWEAISNFPYRAPGRLEQLTWSNRISASGIEAFLSPK